MKDYYFRKFTKDLTMLDHRPVGSYPKSPKPGIGMETYAGSSWADWKSDLDEIPAQERELFVLCLFFTIAVEATFRKYYAEKFEELKKYTAYPGVAWIESKKGLQPKLLLSIRKSQKEYLGDYIDADKLNDIIDSGAMQFFHDIVDMQLKRYVPDIDTAFFFKKMLDDPSFKLDSYDADTPYLNAIMRLEKLK